MKKTYLLFFILSSFGYLAAQEVGTLRGVVKDSKSGEPLAFANVLISELKNGTTTDSRGYFVIPSLPIQKKFTVVISYVGFKNKEIGFSVQPGKVTHLDILLEPTDIQLRTIEQVGEKIIERNSTNLGLQRISSKELSSIPKSVEADLFRMLKNIPGVRSTGDVSANYYVRGSNSNQNLVLLDGMTIYNPFHAIGLFSVIEPDVIRSIEFYKGGFPAEYYGRLASVLNVGTKNGNSNEYHGTAGMSFLSGKAIIEGPIPNGSFILAGRKTYSNAILKKFLNEQSVPLDFYDVNFKVNYSNPEFIKGSSFTFTGFLSNDNIAYDQPDKPDYKWKNNAFGAHWFLVGDTPLFLDIGLTYSGFEGEAIPNASKAKPMLNKINDATFEANFNYIFDYKDEINIGFNMKQLRTELYLENRKGIISDVGSQGMNFGFYAKYQFLQLDNFGADIGCRINLTRLSSGSKSGFEPRINLTYLIFQNTSLKLSTGIFEQELATLTNEDEVVSLFEPWVIIPDYLGASKAYHYSFGIETTPLDNLKLTVEGYYKRLTNLPEFNTEKKSSSDPDLVASQGESYGWEFLLKWNEPYFVFTAGYTLAWAYKERDGIIYYPKYDSRNTINLLLEVKVGSGWSLNAAWNFNTGLPFTSLIGYYEKLRFGNAVEPFDVINGNLPYAIYGDRNLNRLPNYHRLDIGLSKKIDAGWFRAEIDLNAVNIYDRQNVFYFDRETGKRVNSLPFMPTASIKVQI